MERAVTEGLRQRKKETTRRLIERTLLEQVRERGYEAVTVEDVCAQCDISKKTFFNYFESKEAAIMGRRGNVLEGEALCEALERALSDAGASGWNYIDALVTEMQTSFNLGQGHDDIVQLRKEVLSELPQLLFGVHRGVPRMQKSITQGVRLFLERHPEHRMLPARSLGEETVVAASVAMNVMRTRSILSVHGDHVMTAEETRKLIVGFLLGGCESHA